jgi:2-polyprenyl-6-methoxyphenol hydroxylase-like FAD-dependent oxidoreductase
MSGVAVHPKYDVVIVGAGPAGAATAGVLKAINKDLNICVLDTRETTRRLYSLSVAKDSIGALYKVLEANLRPDNTVDHEQIRKFMKSLNKWKGSDVSAQTIEEKMGKWAKRFGVTILRKDAYKEALTKEGLEQLLAPEEEKGLSETQKELRQYFQDARFVTGAAGAHCLVRQWAMRGGDEEKRVDVQNMQYFIELKYKTDGQTKRGKKLKVASDASCQGVRFETMPKEDHSPGATKFATVHFFVGEKTYEAFSQATDKAPWNLEKLQEEAFNNPIIENMARKVAHYLLKLLERKGTCIEPRIKRLPITIYRSVQAVTIRHGRVIAEVGDGLAGAVFARGVNKAFKEAALLAQCANEFFRSNQPIEEGEIPAPFIKYEAGVLEIFKEERKAAEFKAKWIGRGRVALRYILKPIRLLFTPIAALYSWLFPGPTLGELMMKLQGGKTGATGATSETPA